MDEDENPNYCDMNHNYPGEHEFRLTAVGPMNPTENEETLRKEWPNGLPCYRAVEICIHCGTEK